MAHVGNAHEMRMGFPERGSGLQSGRYRDLETARTEVDEGAQAALVSMHIPCFVHHTCTPANGYVHAHAWMHVTRATALTHLNQVVVRNDGKEVVNLVGADVVCEFLPDKWTRLARTQGERTCRRP